jgi:hypothetical protein
LACGGWEAKVVREQPPPPPDYMILPAKLDDDREIAACSA